MKRIVLWLIVLALVGGGAYAGWLAYSAKPKHDPANFRTALVKRSDVVSTITATGTVVPEDVVDVGAQINGQISSFGVDTDGKQVDYRSTVTEGMLLAKIDDSLYLADVASSQAQLEQARAQVRVAEASRDQAQAKLEQSQRDWDRAQKLGQSRALSQADYDAAKSAFEQGKASLALAEASIGQAKASVAIAEASVSRAKRNLTYCTINSPVSGVIIDRRVEIGQTVVASLNAPSLFLLAKDLTRMKVLVQVNEADIGSVKPGQQVTFTVDAFPTESFVGQVQKVRLNATMTQNVVTYTVEILTENKGLKLLPYLTANVKFEIARRTNVLAVPGAALRWTPSSSTGAPAADAKDTPKETAKEPGKDAGREPGAKDASGKPGGRRSKGVGTVWVLDESGPRAITVKTGLSDGTLTEIESDEVSEGLAVIVGEIVSSSSAAGAARSPFAPSMGGPGGGRR